MDEIEDLRRRLQDAERQRDEAEHQRKEEQRRREEEQRSRKEEQRRREEAEELAATSQQQTLQQYLESCHSLHLAMKVVTDPFSTTQGVTTYPVGRIFPRRIVPWDDFPALQEEIWNMIPDDLFSLPVFPSRHQMEYVKDSLEPISSELGLRYFEHQAVEYAVRRLVNQAYTDPQLRSHLGLLGTVTFESHTNLGDTISAHMEGLSPGDGAPAARPSSGQPPRNRRRARGKGNLADQYCICRMSDGQNVPVLAIEYKAPHKLSVDEVVTGLGSGIQPEHDVINKEGEGFGFAARRLAAAVVTQLFSYMIGKGIQYGYVCTGQSIVFLYIPDDPSTVYFSVCVPNQDVLEDDEMRLYRTAVAQVFAFTLQALRATPPPEAWHDEAEKLGLWEVEYDDVLKAIPASDRKPKEPRASPYKPQRWKGFKRTPIQTRSRSRCQPPDSAIQPDEADDDPPSPTPNTGNQRRAPTRAATATAAGSGKRQGKQQQSGSASKPDIQSRRYCTQRCLLGLAYGGAMDRSCPNADSHGKIHLERTEFLRRIRDQLAVDRGRDADCTPLHRSGARGSLFKVRLSSHGYTLVAKGMECMDVGHLQHENDIYDQLRLIQGTYVPVCLGSTDLVRPYYYNSGVYVRFLFLSWAGQPLSHCSDPAGMGDAVSKAFRALHRFDILHRDAEPRNILFDTDSGNLMIVDFERAEFRGRQHLGSIDLNVHRKRKRGMQKKEKDEFAKELGHVVGCVQGLRPDRLPVG
ncbi:hypothetical protein GMORB2_7760 [Geosmithia morbida]|uniref:Protein kinase domain-containing protein n=1 Tax=Geosmithia morbida TaxID=1094350 RepID=A0A9P4YUQ2_9HYPO|nr:uncharacterized protein GMORB2_7760 [Geosmithia morbida]KAF4122167.1 hypothetical protein GMORB2_7760 [Geosmithia morbida]